MIEHPDKELHEMNPTGRFSERVADYVRYRPSYPAEAIDAILEGLAPPVAAADVGAGTGIASRLLADRGVCVVAVEPNTDMRAAAARDERIEWRDGTAEATGLGPGSMDLVLSAHAFHWFRAGEALREFARILKPGGRLCLMWNRRDVSDPLTAAFWQALIDVGGEHPRERRSFDPAVITSTGDFGPPQSLEFAISQRLDFAGLIGRATSASFVPKAGPAYEELVRRLSALFEQHVDATGRVTMRYVTQTYSSLLAHDKRQ
jgi:SAM-dependent methyltransferase